MCRERVAKYELRYAKQRRSPGGRVRQKTACLRSAPVDGYRRDTVKHHRWHGFDRCPWSAPRGGQFAWVGRCFDWCSCRIRYRCPGYLSKDASLKTTGGPSARSSTQLELFVESHASGPSSHFR